MKSTSHFGARRLRSFLAAALCTLAGIPAALAQDAAERAFSLSGFGTLGVVHNSTDKAEYLRDILQPGGVAGGSSAEIDSRLGLQLAVRRNEQLEGVIQVVSYYRYDDTWRPELTWAFVGYAPTPGLKLRAGRLGWDVYMLSDSRNVGYSYLWVRPPADYFGQLQLSHIDGADVVVKHALGAGLASFKLYGGWANQKVPSPPAEDADLTGSRVLGANLDYQRGAWQMRAGYTAVRLDKEPPTIAPLIAGLRASGMPSAASLADELSLAGKTFVIVSGGAVYERGPWQLQVMLNRLTSNTPIYPRKDSGYILLGHRVGEWTPFATYSAARSKGETRATGLPTPNPLDDAVAAMLARAQSRQRTWSLGVRWDFMRNADLKVQVDRVRVDDHATFLWRNAQPDWDGRATIFSVALDFVF